MGRIGVDGFRLGMGVIGVDGFRVGSRLMTDWMGTAESVAPTNGQ